MILREYNEYKITLLFKADGNEGDELDIQLPKTYADGVWIRQNKETALDHVRSKIVHATKKDHVILNHFDKPYGFAVLEPTGYISDKQFNPILVGIKREYKTVASMLLLSKLDPEHDIGTLVMVLNANLGDPTVTHKKTWAVYRFNGVDSTRLSNWTKVTEEESIEFSFSWNDLGAPFKSTKEAIDKMGQDGHNHENLTTLNQLSENLQYLYFGNTKLRRREDINAYKVTENLMVNDIYAGDLVYYVTGNNVNPKLDPNGNPLDTNKESYPHNAQIISPDTLTLSGDCTGYYKDNTELVAAPKIKTAHISHMGEFFSGCTNLVYVPWYDTTDTITMKEMFYNCYSLADIPTFDMTKVKDTTRMFAGCESLKSVPRTSLLSLVKANEMFKDCRTLQRLPDFFTPILEECGSMFAGCTNLLSAPDINVTKCRSTTSMFEGCINMVDCGPMITNSAIYMKSMFKNCHKLRYIGRLDMSSCIDASDIFTGCDSLEHVDIIPETLHCSISFADTQLDVISLSNLINRLTPSNGDLFIDVRNTPAASIDESYINRARLQGWTVITQ